MASRTHSWEVVVHDAALNEVKAVKKRNPRLFNAIMKAFMEMSRLPDPREYRHVEPMHGVAKGWYRLALYQFNFRVVFRLLHEDGENWLELWDCHAIPQEGERAIEIVRAASRGTVYGLNLSHRKKLVELLER